MPTAVDDDNLFSSVVFSIVGQQVSMKVQETIWQRMNVELLEVMPQTIFSAGVDKIQSYGTFFRKAEYIYDFASKIMQREFDLESLWDMQDDEVIKKLSSLKGIGE